MWTYKQVTGELFNPLGVKVAKGYAGGNCGKNPEGVNNCEMQGTRQIGPLPVGLYKFLSPVLQSHLGPFAIPLLPDPGNVMLGRSGFFMHGDTTPGGNASQGCIIMPRAIRQMCWDSEDHMLEVVA